LATGEEQRSHDPFDVPATSPAPPLVIVEEHRPGIGNAHPTPSPAPSPVMEDRPDVGVAPSPAAADGVEVAADAPHVDATVDLREADSERSRERDALLDEMFARAEAGDARREMAARTESGGSSLEARVRLMAAVGTYVLGRVWTCVPPPGHHYRSTVLLRLDPRAARTQVDQMLVDAGWTLLTGYVMYGDADNGLLPDAEERFVTTLEGGVAMRAGPDGAEVMYDSTAMRFFLRNVGRGEMTMLFAPLGPGRISAVERRCWSAPEPPPRRRR
jgi:hypothetical protein